MQSTTVKSVAAASKLIAHGDMRPSTPAFVINSKGFDIDERMKKLNTFKDRVVERLKAKD